MLYGILVCDRIYAGTAPRCARVPAFHLKWAAAHFPGKGGLPGKRSWRPELQRGPDMKQRLIAALLCLCMGMSMLSPAAAAQGPGGLSTGDDSGVVLTTGDEGGAAPTTGDDSGSAPAAGDDSGSAPAAGDDSGSAPAAGDGSGSAPAAGDDSGSAPAAGDGSGSAPATEDDSGSAPTTGDEGGAARPMFRAPTVRLTNWEEHYWDALDLEDGMYLPYTGSPHRAGDLF